MIWAKEEAMSRAETESVQSICLKDTVKRAYEKVPVYRVKMEIVGVQSDDIQTLKDLWRLPFMIKQDTRDSYPYGLLVVPRKELLKIRASSRTTGKPTVVEYTQNDLDVWRECVVRAAAMGGATDEDVAQICFGYGMFTGALGLHNDLEKVRATAVPLSTDNTQKQLMYMKGSETTLLMAALSYATRIAEVVLETGLDPKGDLEAKSLMLDSELMTEVMRNELYRVWREDANLAQSCGMNGLVGLGVSGECLELNGVHISEDHLIAEVVDPKTDQVLLVGEKDELVITCVTKEALPLTRYRIRDITGLMYEPCPCGRTTVRMENLSGRTDDMLEIRGINVFPSQIEEVLVSTDGTGPNYEILVDRKDHSDLLITEVEVEAESMIDSHVALKKLDQSLREKIRMMPGLDARTQLVSSNTLQRLEGKAEWVTDLRVGKNKV